MGIGANGGFQPVGLSRHGWSTGLPYFNPHSFRDMLVRHAMALDLSPEQMKAWSQNLGHADVLTTFTSYEAVPMHKQGELIKSGIVKAVVPSMDNDALLAALAARLSVRA